MNQRNEESQQGGYLSLVQIQKMLNTPLGTLIELVRKNDPNHFPSIVEGDKILYSPLALQRMRRLLHPDKTQNSHEVEILSSQLSNAGNLLDVVERLLARQEQINARLQRVYEQIQHPPVRLADRAGTQEPRQ